MDGKRRRRLLIAVAIIVIAIMPLAVVCLCNYRRAPSYQGKPFAYWFNQLPLVIPMEPNHVPAFKWDPYRGFVLCMGQVMQDDGTFYGSVDETPEAALRAVHSMGTNCLPYLMRELEQRPLLGERFRAWVQDVRYRLHFRHWALPRPAYARHQAVTGLIAESPLPPDIVRRINELSTNSPDAEVRKCAQCILWSAQNNSIVSSLTSNLTVGVWAVGVSSRILSRPQPIFSSEASPFVPTAQWHPPMAPQDQ